MDYGIPDPASNMGGSYADAVTRNSPAPTRAGGGSSSAADQRDFWQQPIRTGGIEYVSGKGYRRNKGKDANGNPIYQDLTSNERASNAGQFSFAREDAKREEERGAKAQAGIDARTERKDSVQAGMYADSVRQQGVANEFTAKNYELQLAGLNNNIAEQKARHDLLISQLGEQANARKEGNQITREGQKSDSDFRNDQLTLNRETLKDTTQLNREKLALEDRHYQQQLEQDQRASRRTQVLGALTMISQAASRF